MATLREHYAGFIMAALMQTYLTACDDHFTLEMAARTALRAADALLEAMAQEKVESERRR